MPYCESDRGGVTRNPWDTERTPGGSSGGSVAAVSAGLVPLALGGDGGGSIRGPAAWTGLPGLFPTVGNVPTAPEPAIWGGLGVPGGFGRSIEDTALLYDVIGTPDWNLRQVIQQDAPPLSIALSYDRASDKPVPTGGPIDASWRQATERTAATLTGLGHAVQPVSVPFGNAAVKFTLRYLAQLGIEAAKTDDPSKLETNTRLLAAIGRPAKRALGWASNNAPERASVEGALRGHAILLTPAMPVPPPRVGENAGQNGVRVSLRAARRVSFLSVWNHLGWPAITVPAGLDPQGLPLGVLLVGRPGSEPLLLQVAAGLEKAAPWPQLAPFRA
jgi:amidase